MLFMLKQNVSEQDFLKATFGGSDFLYFNDMLDFEKIKTSTVKGDYKQSPLGTKILNIEAICLDGNIAIMGYQGEDINIWNIVGYDEVAK